MFLLQATMFADQRHPAVSIAVPAAAIRPFLFRRCDLLTTSWADVLDHRAVAPAHFISRRSASAIRIPAHVGPRQLLHHPDELYFFRRAIWPRPPEL